MLTSRRIEFRIIYCQNETYLLPKKPKNMYFYLVLLIPGFYDYGLEKFQRVQKRGTLYSAASCERRESCPGACISAHAESPRSRFVLQGLKFQKIFIKSKILNILLKKI